MTTNESREALERLLDRALRELPLRRAPRALETRVIRELERRAALAWWRRSFAHWPLLARAGFLVICGALISAVFLGGATAVTGIRSLSWVRELGGSRPRPQISSPCSHASSRRPGLTQPWPYARCCTRFCSDWAPPCTARSTFSL